MGALGGVELMPLAATLRFEQGSTTSPSDGQNEFYRMFRHKLLPALVVVIPVAIVYSAYLYAGMPPSLLFATKHGTTAFVHSAQGVRQGCNIKGLYQITGPLPPLERFRIDPQWPVQ